MSIDIKTPVADFLFLFFFVLSCCLCHCCNAIDTISTGRSMRDDGGETLINHNMRILNWGFSAHQILH
ncbi:hypothetical protein SLE2022_014180 [Rubroshorea leprosula]